MDITDLRQAIDLTDSGGWMYQLIKDLYPICRSITGDGVRQTLARVAEHIPLEILEVPSGTRVFDWTVPPEWNVKDAWIKDGDGHRVVDFGRSNLHVVSYSVPVSATMSLDDLRPHLFCLEDRPSLVPYRTSYYTPDWGFCLSAEVLASLSPGDYEVCVDSTLHEGSLTYGELLIPGATDDEILLSCHICHPSLCNDNLSGIALVTALGRYLSSASLRHSFRLLFIPGTIGAITWLGLNEDTVGRIRHGLVVSGVGDAGPPSYKRSRRGDAMIDRAMALVLKPVPDSQLLDFDPYGYDERQYCSPGFDLPVGRISRSIHGTYPEYHTSGDDLNFVHSWSLGESLGLVLEALEILEHDARYENLNPKCEPQLGRRGLYQAIGGGNKSAVELALLWVLNMSDGSHSLLSVAERAGLAFDVVLEASRALERAGLLQPLGDPAPPARTRAMAPAMPPRTPLPE